MPSRPALRRWIPGWIAAGTLALGFAGLWLGWFATDQDANQDASPATARAGADVVAVAPDAPAIEGDVGVRSSVPQRDARRVIGKLVQGGAPLGGAKVIAEGDGDDVATRSDGDGRFVLAECPGGAVALHVEGATVAPGFGIGPISVAVGEEFDVGTLEVAQPAQVVGRVVDEHEQPVAGARVELGQDRVMATEADGRFAFAALPTGSLRLWIEVPEHEVFADSVQVRSGDALDVGDCILKPAARMHGTVCDERGAPIAGAIVAQGGGIGDELRARMTATTDAAGQFELCACVPDRRSLSVRSPGRQTAVVEPLDDVTFPVRIVLQPELVLRGTVLGAPGTNGVLVVRSGPKRKAQWPPLPRWVFERLDKPFPIAADGSFAVAGLPEGDWLVYAVVPGVGSSAEVSCELPQSSPLQLTLIPDRPLRVRVIAEDGHALPAANAVWTVKGTRRWDWDWLHLPWQAEAATDAEGIATMHAPAGVPLRVQANATGFEGAATELAADAEAHDVVLTLAAKGPTGRLAGTLEDPTILRHTSVHLTCERIGDPSRTTYLEVDARGRFRSGPMAVGSYRVSADIADPWRTADLDARTPEPAARLATRHEVGSPIEVTIAAGTCTEIQVPPLRAWVVLGTVRSAGAPVANALVLACDGDASQYPIPVQESPAFSNCAYAHCGPDGRFCFLLTAPDVLELRARGPTGATWTTPVRVLQGPDRSEVESTLELPTAGIRGRVPLERLLPADRRSVRVRLYPLQWASASPRQSTWSLHGSVQLQALAQEVQPDASGTFRFDGLPAGTFVVRLEDAGDDWPRVVRVGEAERCDLGVLMPSAPPPVQLTSALGKEYGLEIRCVVEGGEVFVREQNAQQGPRDFGVLPPGSYRFVARQMRRVSVSGPYGISEILSLGCAIGTAITVEIHADGTASPATLWPSGIPGR